MNGQTRPPDPELLGFLQTLVNERTESPAQQDRTDSDKENEQSRMQQQSSLTNGGGEGPSKGAGEEDIWGDFDFQTQKSSTADNTTATAQKAADEDHGRDRFESLERVEEEEEEDVEAEADGERKASVSGNESAPQGGNESSEPPLNHKVKKKRRLFTKVRKPVSTKRTPDLPAPALPTVSGGSHPDLSAGREFSRRGQQQQETMSETSGRGGRRLSRRKQVARPRCAGPEPTGDRLQQKYQELQTLMVRPLVEPGQYMLQTRQQLRRLEGINRQYAQAATANTHLPPAGNGSTKTNSRTKDSNKGAGRQAFVELTENNMEEAYATLRTVQVTNHAAQRPQSAQHRKLRPSSARASKGRPLSATQPPRPGTANQTVNNRDRVIDYVANSGNPRGRSETKVSQRNKTGTMNNKQKHNKNYNTSTDTGESTNEVSTSSSQRKRADSDHSEDSSGDESRNKSRERSSSSSSSSRSNDRRKKGHGRKARSVSSSPYGSPRHTETHLKNSNNPALKQWLKRKDKEHRLKRREEKQKLLAEKLEKAEEKRKRDTLFQDSDQKVKEWMTKKRKEAARQAREERKRLREEEKAKKEREEIQQQYNSPYRLTERPKSASTGVPLMHHGRKLFIPVIRPERPIAGGGSSKTGAESTAASGDKKEVKNNGEEAEPKIPRPPQASKFVYKRPVSGKVRLMKLQKERKEDSKRTELEKKLHEKKLAEEKARKMRMSYDQWLLKKREDDYNKRQEAARQRALTQSDPELERIIPEMARRRIENIQRGKRRITTGDKSLDEQVNNSFGGGDFNTSNGEGSATKLELSGSKTSLKQRPASAKASFNPQVSKSPRRPQSAHPRVQSIMDEEDDDKKKKNAFRLPFPPENGAPKHVISRQNKLFAQNLTHPPSAITTDSSNTQQLQETDSFEAISDSSPPLLVEMSNGTPEEANSVQPPASDAEDQQINDNTDTSSSFFVTDGNIAQESCAEGISDNEAEKAGDECLEKDTEPEEGNGHGESSLEEVSPGPTSDSFLEDQQDVSSGTDAINSSEEDKMEEQNGENNDIQQEPCKDPIVNNEPDEPEIDNDIDEVANKEPDEPEIDNNINEVGCNAQNDNDAEGEEKAEKAASEEEGKDESEVRASKHSIKHVSFQEETVVYEPSDDDNFDDGEFYDDPDADNTTRENGDDDIDYGDDTIESYGDENDEDGEAEDERGNYFGDETPRDDF